METALNLARDMASIPVETLCAYKRTIDQGYDLALGDGLELEHKLSSAHNRSVSPRMVEERRAAVQARGRAQ
jgi:enoyl-CoA hydratase